MRWKNWNNKNDEDGEIREELYREDYVMDKINELVKNNDSKGFKKFIVKRYYSTSQERKDLWIELKKCYQDHNGKITIFDRPISKLELIYYFGSMVGKMRNGRNVRFKKYWWNHGYVTDDGVRIITIGRKKDVDFAEFDNNDWHIWKEICLNDND